MWPLKSIISEKKSTVLRVWTHIYEVSKEIDGKMFIFRVNLGMWPLKSIVLEKWPKTCTLNLQLLHNTKRPTKWSGHMKMIEPPRELVHRCDTMLPSILLVLFVFCFMFSVRRKGNNLPRGKAMGEQCADGCHGGRCCMDGHHMGRLQGGGGTRCHASQQAVVDGDSE